MVDTDASLSYNGLSQTKGVGHMPAKRKDYDEAMRMYARGLSIGDVAAFYSISRQAMWAAMKRRGCKFRPQHRYGKENHFYRGGSVADDRAHNIVEQALSKGLLLRRDSCESCGGRGRFRNGRTSIEAHHDDYNKPLAVRWLCKKCHHEWHKTNAAATREE